MEFKEVVLENGLKVCADIDHEAFSQSLGYFVKTGARDEVAEMAGVSHFLEHMVFKGTHRRSAEDVNRELDELGSHSNAYTCEDQTVFYLSVLPEFQGHAIELLTDLMRPALRDDDFEKERHVILEEIAMYDDSPPYGSMERCMEAYFNDHPLSTRVLGTPHTVSQLDTDAMRRYHQERYAADNLILVGTGKIDFDALVAQAENLTRTWKPATFERQLTPPSPTSKQIELEYAPAVQQYTFELIPGVSRFDQRRFAWRLMATMLGDDSGSRTFWALLDPGLAESAGLFSQEYDDCGLIGRYLTCGPEETAENWELFDRVMHDCREAKFSEQELEIAKNKTLSSLILASERPSNRLFTVGTSVSQLNQYEPLDKVLSDYKNVTLAEVQQAIDEVLELPRVRVTIGPKLGILP
jgi:predicted Zn-dependent peptidase